MVELTLDEQLKYLDPQLIQLMTPMMVSDSSSYTFLLMQDAAARNRVEFGQTLYY